MTPTQQPSDEQHEGVLGEAPEKTEAPTATMPEPAAITPPSSSEPVAPAGPMPVFDDRRQRPSRKKWLFVGLGVALLLALIGGGAYAYTQYQKPENVVLDAVIKAATAKTTQAKVTITSSYSYENSGTKISLKRLVVDLRGTVDPRADQNASLELLVNDKLITLNAQGFVDDNGDVYFRLNNLDQAARSLYSIFGDSDTPSAVIEALAPIQNKWVRYSLDDMRRASEASAKTTTCMIDTYKKYQKDGTLNRDLTAKYKAHPFVKATNNGTSRDGLTDYEVSIDSDKLTAFSADMLDTQLSKDLRACDGSQSSSQASIEHSVKSSPLYSDSSNGDISTKVHVLVEPWLHELRRIETTTTFKNGATSETVSTVSELAYDNRVALAAPSGAVSVEEWLKHFDKLGSALSDNQPSGIKKVQKTADAKNMATEALGAANQYAAEHRGALPPNAAAVQNYLYSSTELGATRVTAKPPIDETSVQYAMCGTTEAYIVYYDANAGHLAALGVGSGRDTQNFSAGSACRGNIT